MTFKKCVAVLLALLCVTVLFAGCYQFSEPELPYTDPAPQTVDAPQTEAPAGEEPKDIHATSPPAADGETTAATTTATTTETATATTTATATAAGTKLDENGSYYSRDDVALYIRTYGHLPPNYMTKKQAQALGWSGGSLEQFAPGKAIGGGRYGNYEGLLPDRPGRYYTECDIDTLGKSKRGSKRIVFSNDGLIYYTDDHYKSFTLLYGEE